jgi:hypothetical protein
MVVYKRVHVSGGIGELLEVVHVPVDVSGGLEICVGLQLGESLVLLVFLNKTKAKLGDKLHQENPKLLQRPTEIQKDNIDQKVKACL